MIALRWRKKYRNAASSERIATPRALAKKKRKGNPSDTIFAVAEFSSVQNTKSNRDSERKDRLSNFQLKS